MTPARRLSLATAFARSWLSYFLEGSPRPLSATLCITHRCNLRCVYCNSPNLDVPELGLAQIEIVLDRLVAAGVKRVGITGGEPLLRPDLPAIVRAIRLRGLIATVNTNLTLFERNPDALNDLDMVLTSLDGDSEAHVANRGRGSHEGVLRAIETLVSRGTPVVAITVITEQNVELLDYLLDQADGLGFRVHLQPRIAIGVCARGERSDDLSDERERRFWKAALARKLAGRPIASSRMYLEALTRWDRFDVPALFDETTRCSAGRAFLYVDPNGDAYPCIYLKGTVEAVNLVEQPWRHGCKDTPCTRCLVGPHLEFNTLYQNPLRGALSAARTYA